jgi:ATP synthase I subunit
MGQVADTSEPIAVREPDDALERRLLRGMVISVAIAVVLCAAVAPWRVTTGLVLGGLLSLLNYRWLHSSVAAVLNVDLMSQRPRANASRYLLRYVVVGGVVFTAYNLQLVSLAATIAGLCSFVPALLIEAGREFYLAIIHREESY